ncbi:MAG TPA: disulfide bond formation protein B [Alphaproteobacteria bacterium]|nr:disulfide bond formation protein B [Alphaproteobacteria bacterium]
MEQPTRLYPALIAAASVAVLAAAFAFQYLGGLQPCILCVYQRYPYGVAIALGVVGLVLPRGRAQSVLVGLAALVFLVDAGIAGFHVGVEQHWWEGTASCGGAAPAVPQNLDSLMKSLEKEPVRCDAVAWSLFGISMAGYNFLIALALAAFSAVAARRLGRSLL